MRARDAQERLVDRARGTATERGYDSRWRRYSAAYRVRHPLCHYCALLGRTMASECVDHAVPPRGDQSLFWAPSNHRPACIRCNSVKGDRTEAEYLAWLGCPRERTDGG